MTTYWPNELAHMVVKKLKNRYEPYDRVPKTELIRELNEIRMNASDDPKDLFGKVSGIQRNFTSAKYTVSE